MVSPAAASTRSFAEATENMRERPGAPDGAHRGGEVHRACPFHRHGNIVPCRAGRPPSNSASGRRKALGWRQRFRTGARACGTCWPPSRPARSAATPSGSARTIRPSRARTRMRRRRLEAPLQSSRRRLLAGGARGSAAGEASELAGGRTGGLADRSSPSPVPSRFIAEGTSALRPGRDVGALCRSQAANPDGLRKLTLRPSARNVEKRPTSRLSSQSKRTSSERLVGMAASCHGALPYILPWVAEVLCA